MDLACNYEPTANIDDNSCEFGTCPGCNDPTDYGYNPTSTNDSICGTSALFTNCGAEGRFGPTQQQCDEEYGPGFVSCFNGLQHYVVQMSGVYEISAFGAQGGSASGGTGGLGAHATAFIELHSGDTLQILVGQMGSPQFTSGGDQEAGGGGGTYVALNNQPLVVAGGGGAIPTSGPDWTPPTALDLESSNGSAGSCGVMSSEGYAGGCNGLGGYGTVQGGGGGGFYTAGINNSSNCMSGLSFVDGGVGGEWCGQQSYAHGGFGGGGSGGNDGGGGGGGYSGGGGYFFGGGGGSYIATFGAGSTASGVNSGHGLVEISLTSL